MRFKCLLIISAIAIILFVDFGNSRRSGGSGGRRRGSFGSVFKAKRRPAGKPSYPKQTYGTVNRGSQSVGGGGFVNPGRKNVAGSGTGAIGGGGFYNPKVTSNFGGNRKIYGNTYINNNYHGGSYSGFGSSNFGHRSGSSMGGGKAFGLGVGAGFIGGAVAGIGAMQVYHQYKMYQYMMMSGGYGGYHYGMGYGNPMMGRQSCFGGCPMQSFCDYGICRCYSSFFFAYGSCWSSRDAWERERAARSGLYDSRTKSGFNASPACAETSDCWKLDINMFCGNNTCVCRQNMKWNSQGGECQIHLDVDCSKVTSGLTSLAQTSGVTSDGSDDKAEDDDDDATVNDVPGTIPNTNGSVSASETLADSSLIKLDPKNSTAQQIKEAFCRDVDRFAVAPSVAPPPVEKRSWYSSIGFQIFLGIAVVAGLVTCCFLCKRKSSRRFGHEEHVQTAMESMEPAQHQDTTWSAGYPTASLPEGAVGAPAAPGYNNVPATNNLPYPVQSTGFPAYPPQY